MPRSSGARFSSFHLSTGEARIVNKCNRAVAITIQMRIEFERLKWPTALPTFHSEEVARIAKHLSSPGVR